MLFNSLQFAFFFVAVCFLYFTLPHRFRWLLLLIASCYFYMVFVPVYILILGFTIIVDYFAGIYLENAVGRKRKMFLIASLVANISILAVFKYYNFLNDNLTELLGIFNMQNRIPYLSILLPVGLSFHTFQAMSYTIEIYRGHQKAERHFGIYALYVMFFPQLVAGPIERPQNLLHQFYEKHKLDLIRIGEGLRLMLWGLFKKIVIADRLSIYVDAVYGHSEHHSSPTFILATLFFAIQIYCDFSGYSDIAIGSARVLGFKLMTNFNQPYFSRSISEFWTRWHISLSTWFKDYLYISLGGNRVAVPRWYFNLFFVFLVSGLWHGANWTFIIWGGLNGLYLILGTATEKIRSKINKLTGLSAFPRINNFMQVLITFALVCISWIFFRAENVSVAFRIIKTIFTFNGSLYIGERPIMAYSILAIALLFLVELKREHFNSYFSLLNNKNWLIRNFSYAALVIIILMIAVFNGGQFIYFQF